MKSNEEAAARTLTFILAGGEGRRLSPLTKYRPKPLIPFGGCYRIIDFTLSNCLNSALKRAYVLTQHESESISAYLRKGWTRVGRDYREFALPAPPTSGKRYMGTASAVLQNLSLLHEQKCDFALVLSADHLYRMDYRDLLSFHVATRAEATIATVDCPREFSTKVGVLEVDDSDRVVGFEEKPYHPKSSSSRNAGMISASMGVYVFTRELLAAAMAGGGRIIDFANDLIPTLIGSSDVRAYRHEDPIKKTPLYWRDVGTPEAYYASSMDLLASGSPIDPNDSGWPIRSADRAQLNGQSALSQAGRAPEINSIIPNGVNIGGASVYETVLSPGVVLESGADVRHSVLMPGVVIGRGAAVRRAIIDANVVIDADDEIGYNPDRDRGRFHVLANGVVVVSSDHISLSSSKAVINEVQHTRKASKRAHALILFVDGDKEVRKVMKTYLESQDFDVITAANGSEGLRAFENNNAVRVVVTDLNMPLMNGDTMIRKVLKINSKVNVILASADVGSYRQAVRERTDISLAKPYMPEELAGALRELLSRAKHIAPKSNGNRTNQKQQQETE